MRVRTVLVMASAVLLASCGGDDTGSPTTQSGGTTAVSPAEGATPGAASAFAADGDHLWVVDTATLEATELADVEPHVGPLWIAAGQPVLIDTEGLRVYDSSGGQQTRLDIFGVSALAEADDGAVYIVSIGQTADDPAGILSKLVDWTVAATLETERDPYIVFEEVAVGGGSVWVSYGTTGGVETLVSRVDPETLEIVGSTELEIRPRSLAFGEGSLWVAGPFVDGDETEIGIVRLAPDGSIEATIRTTGAELQSELTTGFGSVWVVDATGSALVRIDPATNEVVSRIPVGDSAARNPYIMNVTAGDETIWVNNPAADTLYAIDPQTEEIVGELSYIGRTAFVFR